MPKFTVTSPEGKTYTGTAPDGATQDDIFAYVQKQIVSQQPISFAERTLGVKTLTPEQSASPVDPNYQVGQGYERAQFESHPAVRFLRGIEGPAIKAIELLPGDSQIQRDVASIGGTRRAGMDLRYGDPNSPDIMGAAGAVVPGIAVGSGIGGAAGKVGSALGETVGSYATSAHPVISGLFGVGGRAVTGAGIGGATAGMQPGSTMEDVQSGAAWGGAIPLVIDTGKGLGAIRRYLADKTIPSRMYDKWLTDKIGADYLDPAARKLETALPNVPGEKLTAAQAMVGSPAGTVIQSHAPLVARTGGGISSDFIEREMKNEAARKIAGTYAKQVTVPKALDALNAANQGGVQSSTILTDIQSKAGQVGLSTVARKSLASVTDDIAKNTDASGKIDAHELWRIRKELGDVIGGHAKALNNWSKKGAIETEATIQSFLDDAIEASGGRGWKDFLTEYSGRMSAIKESALQNKLKYKPQIRTDMLGGVNMAEYGTRHILPNWLSKPITLTKWGAGELASKMEPYVDARAAAANLDKDIMAQIIRSRQAGGMPSRNQAIIDALMQQLPAQAGTAAGRQF